MPTSDNIGWIEVLYNKEFVTRLNIDLEAGSSCCANLLYLTPVIAQVFESFLLQKKHLTIIANHPSRFSKGVQDPYQIRQNLLQLGAHVHFFRSPRLCHEKILLIPPGTVYLGSHNFSINGLFKNNESTVRFFSPSILDKLHARIVSRIEKPPSTPVIF